MSSVNNKLKETLSNWATLGEIKQGEKINISEVSAPGFGRVTIAKADGLQGLFRAFTKAFTNDIAEGNTTKEWIGQFQARTLNTLGTLDIRVDETTDTQELASILDTLEEMKKVIKESSTGLDNLGKTYGDSRIYQAGETLKKSLEARKLVNDAIIQQIDTKITQLRDLKESKGAAIGEILKNSDPVEGEMNSAQAEVKMVQNFVKGEGLSSLPKTITGKDGSSLELPEQFYLDLPRTPHLSLNNQVIYSSLDKENYDLVAACKSLKAALGDSDRATAAVMNLTTQGMFAGAVLHLVKSNMEKFNEPIAVAKNEGVDFQYKINIEGDAVKIEYKNSYALRDFNGNVKGYQLVRRDLKLSLEELQQLDVNNKESTLKTISVTDTYSEIIDDKDTASRQYQKF